MSTLVWGSRFIGFGRPITCSRCHNKTLEHVSIEFSETGAFYAPFFTHRRFPFVHCPICMSRTESDPSLELLVEIVDVGKAYTREAYQTLNKDSKWKLRRDLKKLGFLDLLNFVAERTSP